MYLEMLSKLKRSVNLVLHWEMSFMPPNSGDVVILSHQRCAVRASRELWQGCDKIRSVTEPDASIKGIFTKAKN
jgi:hypothetical protein